MKRLTVLFTFIAAFEALGATSLVLSQPRYPSKQKDNYRVSCQEACEVEIETNDPLRGKLKTKNVENKIRDLIYRIEHSGLPQQSEKNNRKTLYTITALDGKKQVAFHLGYPKSYAGPEFVKFARLISLIEEIKLAMMEVEKK